MQFFVDFFPHQCDIVKMTEELAELAVREIRLLRKRVEANEKATLKLASAVWLTQIKVGFADKDAIKSGVEVVEDDE